MRVSSANATSSQSSTAGWTDITDSVTAATLNRRPNCETTKDGRLGWLTAKRKLLANRFHSICDWPKSCGIGGCKVPTLPTRTGFSPVHSGGKLPYWPGSLYKAHLEPEAKEVGIVGYFGWHTFRHTYATLLKGNGEDVKVVQELMRHANISVTLNVYAQAITQTKRDAQSRVVSCCSTKTKKNHKWLIRLASPTGFEPVLPP
jgi:Phage integrase family